MPIQSSPQELKGNWECGWALDLHTISSVPLPNGSFDTKRTEVGELLYQLKYCLDRIKIEPLATTAADFLKTRLFLPYLSCIIPVPPSDINRPFQPVMELALEIGKKVNLPVLTDFIQKIKETEPLKGIDDLESRRVQLKGAFRVKDKSLAGKYVLLFDDLFRSGETLREVTRVLMGEGAVSKVYVLAITKTRTKR